MVDQPMIGETAEAQLHGRVAMELADSFENPAEHREPQITRRMAQLK